MNIPKEVQERIKKDDLIWCAVHNCYSHYRGKINKDCIIIEKEDIEDKERKVAK